MSEEEVSGILGEFNDTAEIEGLSPGTEPFARRVRQLKVLKCREFRNVFTCSECIAYDECELIKQVLRDHRGTPGAGGPR